MEDADLDRLLRLGTRGDGDDCQCGGGEADSAQPFADE